MRLGRHLDRHQIWLWPQRDPARERGAGTNARHLRGELTWVNRAADSNEAPSTAASLLGGLRRKRSSPYGRPGSIRAPSRGRHRSRGEVRQGGRVVRRERNADRARQRRRPVPVRTSRAARAYREASDDSVGERGGQRRTRLPPWILSDGQRPIVAASRCASGRDRDQESHVSRSGYFETARLRDTDVGLPFATATYPEDPLKTRPASDYPTRFLRSACPHGARIRP
jgi:hypothetical protein